MNITTPKSDKRHWSIVLVLAVSLEFLHLVDSEWTLWGMSIASFDFFVTFLWGVFLFIKCFRFKASIKEYLFAVTALIGIVMVVTSTMQANYLYDQPLVWGFIPQRIFLLWMLVYFPLSKAVSVGYITKEHIEKAIVYVGTAQLVIFITQYLVGDRVTFVYVHTGQRYDQARYYFQCLLLDLLYFIKLNKIIRRKHKKFDYIYLIAIIFEVMVVEKYRLTTLGLLAATVVVVLMTRYNAARKYGFVLLGIAAAVLLFQTQMVQDVLETIFGSDKGTLTIRELGREYYFSVLRQHPLFGAGYPNTGYSIAAASFSGYLNNYFVNDNGVVGFIFMYGIPGVLWVVTAWVNMIRYGVKVNRGKSTASFLWAFPVFCIITMINEAHWYWQGGTAVLVIFWVLIESYYKDRQEDILPEALIQSNNV